MYVQKTKTIHLCLSTVLGALQFPQARKECDGLKETTRYCSHGGNRLASVISLPLPEIYKRGIDSIVREPPLCFGTLPASSS